MVNSDIDAIVKDIDRNLADLHTLFVNDVATVSQPYYNRIVVSLNKTREEILDAMQDCNARKKELLEKYGDSYGG